jgi:hypothetical protein
MSNLPDNVSPNDPSAPWNQDSPDRCDVCDLPLDDCQCKECPLCGLTGEKGCHQEVDLGVCGGLYNG